MTQLPSISTLLKAWSSLSFSAPRTIASLQTSLNQVLENSVRKGDANSVFFATMYPQDKLEMLTRFIELPMVMPSIKARFQNLTSVEMQERLDAYFWSVGKRTAAEFRDNVAATEEMIRRFAHLFILTFEGEDQATTFSKLQSYSVDGLRLETPVQQRSRDVYENSFDNLRSKFSSETKFETSLQEAVEEERKNPPDRGWRE